MEFQNEYINFKYNLTKKNIKNINIRVHTDGMVNISVPYYLSDAEIQSIITKKSEWIKKTIDGMKQRVRSDNLTYVSDAECYRIFGEISDKIYNEIFKYHIDFKPEIKVKQIKSAWGVCHVKKRYITLNKRLASLPPDVIEYVIMHEYVHFLEPNHQAGFHNQMKNFMPDYKQRETLLKTYV